MEKNNWRIWLSILLSAFLLCAGVTATAQQSGSIFSAGDPRLQAGLTAQTIKSVVEKTQHPLLKWPRFPYYQDELQGLYEPQGYAPLWLSGGRPIKQAREVIDILAKANTRGLHPEDYDTFLLDKQWRELNAGAAYSAYEQGLFDTALSIGLLRHISDLHIGRVNPKNINFGLNVEPKKYDLAVLVRSALANNTISQTVAAAEPPYPQYQHLKRVLLHYQRLAQDPNLGPVPVTATVHPGESYAGLGQLRQLLRSLGDLRQELGAATNSNLYQGEIVEAVKRFQARHGLEVDGLMGKGTFAALNVPMKQRVRQIELALERLRWLPLVDDSERFIVVNVPAFRLWGFNSANVQDTPAVTMNVVVGQAIDKRQTPVFVEAMRYVIFSPYWNVPYSITTKELLPKIRGNPGYLKANDMEIVSAFGPDAKPLNASSQNISKLGSGGLKLRQKPGRKNALGPAKFIFPNNHAVYLHGTPQQQLFSRTRRDFSHGCIRVEDPVMLAEFVLNGKDGWNRPRIQEAMGKGRPTKVNLDRPLPVLIFYTTVLVSSKSGVSFYNDVYGHDAALDRLLLAGYPYAP